MIEQCAYFLFKFEQSESVKHLKRWLVLFLFQTYIVILKKIQSLRTLKIKLFPARLTTNPYPKPLGFPNPDWWFQLRTGFLKSHL